MKKPDVMLSIDDVARVCHEANRAYCTAMGDNSHKTWDTAPSWQKASAIMGVESAVANPDKTPEESHEAWVREKEAAGWKKGPVKAPDRKEHPCLVPYADLPASQKAKDVLFLSVVRSLAPLLPEFARAARAEEAKGDVEEAVALDEARAKKASSEKEPAKKPKRARKKD